MSFPPKEEPQQHKNEKKKLAVGRPADVFFSLGTCVFFRAGVIKLPVLGG